MTEERNQLAQLFAACWKDEALKQRFMNDPKAVLAEHGMPVPDGMDVKVVENADNCVHITMPDGARGTPKTFQMKNSVPLRGVPAGRILSAAHRRRLRTMCIVVIELCELK